VIDERVEQFLPLLVCQAAVVNHLDDMPALVVGREVTQQRDGGAVRVCLHAHGTSLVAFVLDAM
jgi:hypothetical protein